MVTQTATITADDQFMKEALEQADPLTLRAVIYQFTGDESLWDLEMSKSPALLAEVPALAREEDAAMLRARTLTLLQEIRDGKRAVPPAPTGEQLRRIMNIATGTEIKPDQLPFFMEELALDPMPRQFDWSQGPAKEKRAAFKVAVIGAGFGGLNAAIQLKDAGIQYRVYERNGGPGGTWYQNTYPGFRVDIASRIYSYTFEAQYDWEHTFAPQGEIKRYIESVIDKYGIGDSVQYDTEVMGADWSDESGCWTVHLRSTDGREETIEVNALISCVGLLDRLRLPDIEGLDSFEGKKFHTARWDHDYDYTGKKVCVIGTGATGMQLVPDMAPVVEQLTVFQRSAGWVIPVPGYRQPVTAETRWLYNNVPYYVNWFRLRMTYNASDDMLYDAYDIDPEWQEAGSHNRKNHALRERLVEYMLSKVGHDEHLAKACLPNYAPMAKRIILDNGWFDALLRDNVDLVTTQIERITPKGVKTTDGKEYEADLLVLASGFRPNDFLYPMDIRGREGKTLQDLWAKDGARAYWGMMMPGFPNLWCLYGPNTNQKTGGPVMWGEMQVRYALGCMKELIANDWKAVDVKREVYDEHQAKIDAILSHSIWMDQNQRSYYRNDFGRVATNTAWGSLDYWKATRTPNLDDFDIS